MGSQSDWKVLSSTEKILKDFDIKHEKKIVSAQKIKKRKVEVVIAGAGGAAHLPGMISPLTSVPVIGVPIETKTLKGLDSLLSIVQMPAGIPVPTVAIGKPGAINAALAAISILGNKYPEVEKKLENFRIKQTKSIKKIPINE